MTDATSQTSTLDIFLAELLGTALLLLLGLSLVILMFGSGSPVALLLPDIGIRRAITGFLFGGIGASIALSPLGRVSGAHINPIVSLGFRLAGRLSLKMTLVYILAQLLGATLGVLPLLLWGDMGKSVMYGATVTGAGFSTLEAFLGEVITTFSMISLLTIFLAFRRIRRFTPGLFPPLYAFMSWAESPISGTSTNPARSFGPALVSGQWQGWWIYWLGPMTGALLALIIFSFLAKRIEVAKLYHFDTTRDRLFRRKTVTGEKETVVSGN